MVFLNKGMTLMEIIIVLIIIGIATACFSPNFIVPTEQARSANAKNNLLAIYTAEQNYNNNFNHYCLSTTAAQPGCTSVDANCAGTLASNDTLAAINCNLNLNIQDSEYQYTCPPNVSGTPQCTATRTSPASAVVITATLNTPTYLSGGTLNPTCTPSSSTYSSWCF